jgi:hypothetical protein
MSLCHKTYQRWAALAVVLAVVLVALPAVLWAQSDETVPKEQIFVGYQWLNPGGSIPNGNAPPLAYKLPAMAPGFGLAFAYNFDKNLALEGDYGANWSSHASMQEISVGPKATWRGEGVDFFVHTLLGVNRLDPRNNSSLAPATVVPGNTGIGAVLGGGIDLKLWKPITLRLFEADYVWSRHNFASAVAIDNPSLRRSGFDGARLRTGVVFNFGGAPPVPVAAACTIDHTEVMVGEPLHTTVAASNFNPKHKLTYTWASNGGKIEGKDTGATIDTNGANPGDYAATATVTDPKEKSNNTATCSSKFTVKPLNPPQISCSASPASVDAGATVTVTCTCTSPDNVPVTVGGWSASGGSLSGSGNSATLNTTGASPGKITINATCTDSRGLTAATSSSTTVNVPPPPPPPPPQASKLNECEYPNVKKPWRVDNTCKAMLDDVAGKLQQDPDAKLVVVGNSGPKEKRKNLAGERAEDVKYYITEGEAQQHIDASRIECRTGNAGTATSEQWIIPAGATFPNADSTAPVDEKKVKAIPDHPKPAAKKAAKKKAE